MAAVVEAEAVPVKTAVDPGPQLGLSPATPDIVRKPAWLSGTNGANGSYYTALFASPSPGFPKVEGNGSIVMPSSVEELSQSALFGPDKAESGGFISVPSPVGGQLQCAPEVLGGMGCAVSTEEYTRLPAEVCESSGKISQERGKSVAMDTDPRTSGPVPTPDKVEPSPRRRRKKSTKGVPRFKVMKDKIMKPTVTPKNSTPVTTRKKIPQEGGNGHMGTGNSNTARRKLDVDSPEIKACFSRAKLIQNLRCLAKSTWPCTRMRSKRVKKRKFIGYSALPNKQLECASLAIVPYQSIQTDAASSSTLVPHAGTAQLDTVRQTNVKTRVLGLDDETLQVYDVLRKWDKVDTESFDGFNIGSGPEWDKRRRILEQCVDVFIATMHDLLGPRKFSQWGGSVIDSVVGTFLTQNVADNLSSTAFMNLAAKFPPSNRCHKGGKSSNVPLVDGVDENFYSDKEDGYDNKAVKGHYGQEYGTVTDNLIAGMKQNDMSALEKDHLLDLVKSGNPMRAEKTLRDTMPTSKPNITSDWDNLREEAYGKGYNKTSGTGNDAVDWESVLRAPIREVEKCIEVRGQYCVLASRIQEFLARVKKDHGSFDMDWLRYVPRESAKNYLLSFLGLGDKSVDCISLLSLRHKAFPVDVNVARIVTRLGWVQLQPLEGSVEFHLVNSYPIMRDVQRYLWPRLCTIDKDKLYELHYLMITFGKVMCTKTDPNCSACPFSAKCKYYTSSHRRLSLPPAQVHEHERGRAQTRMLISGGPHLSNGSCMPCFQQTCQHQIEISSMTTQRQPIHNCEPIIEAPPSPEYEFKEAPNEVEESYKDGPCDLEDIVLEGVQYDAEIDLRSSLHTVNNSSWTSKYGNDLVLINAQCNFGQDKKLKNVGRLRTEHNAYVLPDDHLMIHGRVPEDPCPYLLVVISCPDNCIVKGTILIPCRTATRGNFPLNGTYFQEHEVFADHQSSRSPISVPRSSLLNLERCTVYFGSSIHSITKGQTKQDIQDCYKKGYICVGGFDRATRQPKRLCGILHATKNEKKEGTEMHPKRTRTSPEERTND